MRTPEGRGGARVPSGGPRVSGVGRFSQRSDAQPVNVPNVGDSEDLRQGDRAKLEAALRQRPLARASTPRVAPAPRGGNSPAAAGGGGPGNLPPLDIPTTRPDEPETTGLPFGPGGGPEVLQSYQEPDDRQLILRFLARGGNEDANRILSGMVDSQRPAPLEVAPLLSSAEEVEEVPEEAVVEEPSEDIAPEELAPEQPNIPEEAMME